MATLTMQAKTSVAANTTVQNIVSGQRYERSPFTAAVGQLLATSSAIGLNLELNVGGISITPPMEMNIQNRYPVEPDDLLVHEFEVTEGKLIQLTAVNTTGAAITAYWRIILVEVELPQ